jgi:hypothetical protein
MLDKIDLPPQPLPPRRWSTIIWPIVVVGVVVIFFAVPSFRNSVVAAWDGSKTFLRKLFGF